MSPHCRRRIVAVPASDVAADSRMSAIPAITHSHNSRGVA
jgi:hypothetical protein